MNRWDEIQGLARDIASNVHADPVARDVMANDLIKLCGLMIAATGKIVVNNGEADMFDDEDDDTAQARCRTGEDIQTGARLAVARSTDADLERWTRPTPGDPCRCGHGPRVHHGGSHAGDAPCDGERYNGEACKGGPCTGFVREPRTGGWKHVDRRPDALRGVRKMKR